MLVINTLALRNQMRDFQLTDARLNQWNILNGEDSINHYAPYETKHACKFKFCQF